MLAPCTATASPLGECIGLREPRLWALLEGWELNWAGRWRSEARAEAKPGHGGPG